MSGALIEIPAQAWTAFKADYLRPQCPTLASCYDRTVFLAERYGWGALPCVSTFRRRLDAEVGEAQAVARRGGAHG